MNVLQALQDEHDLTLVTVTSPDLGALNRYYGTDVRSAAITVDRVWPVGTAIQRIASGVGVPDVRLWKLRGALLKRFWDASPYDIVVSTYNEFSFSVPALQYVHYPNGAGPRRRIHEWVYLRLAEAIDGRDREQIRSSTLLANSEWTAGITDDVYGVRPRVVYPPVNTTDFETTPWADREQGIVSIGRIEPTKNVCQIIEIVRRVRERGHDVHLHLVGPIAAAEYGQRVRRRARSLDFVELEGPVERPELVDLVTSHRYGLHGKESEHFGMAVAELLAGGTVPFVPDSGGQREVVAENDDLMYGSLEEAVTKISHICSLPDRGASVRPDNSYVKDRFGPKRFRETIASAVEAGLRPPRLNG